MTMTGKGSQREIRDLYLAKAYSQPVSVQNSLLLAMQWCATQDDMVPIFRRQLFLVAGVDFGEINAEIRHPQTFQRAIETATDAKGFFEHFPGRGSGEYLPTNLAFAESIRLFGKLPQVYRSLRKKDFDAEAICSSDNPKISIEYLGGEISGVVVVGEDGRIEFPDAKKAVDYLRSKFLYNGLPLDSDAPVNSLEAMIYGYRPLPANDSWNV